ncbi:MAG: SMC family ATPase [Cyanobacteria bacterium J06638_28]
MQILAVALKNFKTHQDKYFTFSPGTNAICGENGAGKTSILEAIAWVLFNHQGEYAKDDLVRNGSGSAEVTVDFVSNQDGRTYTVQRHTNRGYTLFDPQLNARLPYTRIKDEVLPWLREHLGVAPGTDLGELFARTVGVPQGTFTADFLQSPENRKRVFDKILKVEEYKTVHKDLNSLRRYAEAQVEMMEREIASYEERLATWDGLQARHQSLTAELAQTEAQLATLATQLATIQQERDAVKAQAEKVQQLQAQSQQVRSQVDGRQQAIALLTQSLEQAQQATKICAANQLAHAAYQQAEVQLQTLNEQQRQRQSLQKQQQKLQKTLQARAQDLTRLQVQLDTFRAAAIEITQLQPQIQHQTQLETELQSLQVQQTALAKVQGELHATTLQGTQLTQQIQQVSEDIKRLETLSTTLTDLPALEQQRDRLQQQLSRLEAARQFETELQRLVEGGQHSCDRHRTQTQVALATLEELRANMPLLPASSIESLQIALHDGVEMSQTILGQVQQILADLASQTDAAALKSQQQAVRQKLKQLSQHQTTVAGLPERQQHLTQLQHQQETVTHRLAELQQTLAAEAELITRLTSVQAALTALADPRGRCAVLAKSCRQQPTIQRRHDEMQVAQGGIQTQIEALEVQLQDFNELDGAIATQNQLKQAHQAAYQQYLQYERVAQDETRLTQELAATQQTLTQLQAQQQAVDTALQAAQANFNPQRAQQVDATYQDLRSQRDRLVGGLPQQQQLLAELQRQIDELRELAQQRDEASQARKKRDRVKRFINFARKAYKETGPRITERYVYQVSREADRLFRELLNRQNVALLWTRDYEIQVQEGPNTRRFINLSGGEQMCAALAVRLALLKVLADIDIAFFDEPTTNMDRPRRESLAEAIARIRSFSQLFVISHDDTFEQVTENVIVVERDS